MLKKIYLQKIKHDENKKTFNYKRVNDSIEKHESKFEMLNKMFQILNWSSKKRKRQWNNQFEWI